MCAGSGFDDFQPLKAILKDVHMVALDEATHGMREFFTCKQRLVEFLFVKMGFTVFTIEAGYAARQPINDSILDGTGDLVSVLTGQRFIPWDNKEAGEMVMWMRRFQQGRSRREKGKI